MILLHAAAEQVVVRVVDVIRLAERGPTHSRRGLNSMRTPRSRNKERSAPADTFACTNMCTFYTPLPSSEAKISVLISCSGSTVWDENLPQLL